MVVAEVDPSGLGVCIQSAGLPGFSSATHRWSLDDPYGTLGQDVLPLAGQEHEGRAVKKIIMIAAALAIVGSANAAPAINDPAKLIRTLYASSATSTTGDPLWWSYLTGKAQSTFARVLRAEKASGDELIDADFLCQCQDTEHMRVVSIALSPQTTTSVRARVQFTNFGSKQLMVFDLVNDSHGWKIAEMTSGDGHAFTAENLRALKEAGK
jgi:hypothetical protein